MTRRVRLAAGLAFLTTAGMACGKASTEDFTPQPAAPATSSAPAATALPASAPPGRGPSPGPASPAATSIPGGSATAGGVSGTLMYPSGGPIPAMKVYALRADQGGDKPAYWWVHLAQGQGTAWSMDGLQPGTYYVFAYTDPESGGNLAGGYTKMVPCGLQASCTDHTLIAVDVKAGQVTTGINVADWYAPAAAFPPRPTYFG